MWEAIETSKFEVSFKHKKYDVTASVKWDGCTHIHFEPNKVSFVTGISDDLQGSSLHTDDLQETIAALQELENAAEMYFTEHAEPGVGHAWL